MFTNNLVIVDYGHKIENGIFIGSIISKLAISTNNV